MYLDLNWYSWVCRHSPCIWISFVARVRSRGWSRIFAILVEAGLFGIATSLVCRVLEYLLASSEESAPQVIINADAAYLFVLLIVTIFLVIAVRVTALNTFSSDLSGTKILESCLSRCCVQGYIWRIRPLCRWIRDPVTIRSGFKLLVSGALSMSFGMVDLPFSPP